MAALAPAGGPRYTRRMAGEKGDEMLREAAKARGFRLVKSRRRKPGGDFGLYGLVDLKTGRECLGFGKGELTATSDEVHSYLRGGEVAAWKRSLIGVVGGDEPKLKKAKGEEAPKASARPERSRGAPAQERVRDEVPSASPRRTPKSEKPAPASRRRPSTSLGTSGEGGGRQDTKVEKEEEEEQEERKAPRSQPRIRDATRRDAAALAKLIGIPAATLAERLAAAIRADEAPLVAERDGLVGCAAWTIVQTLQHGPRGRITLLFVAEGERRQEIGARLLAQAEQRLRDAGVSAVEMSLDIDFDAPAGFLRHAGFTRSANGYGKAL
jgi:N-acetylglutamate synthase-like GNAT family acetyltransferase